MIRAVRLCLFKDLQYTGKRLLKIISSLIKSGSAVPVQNDTRGVAMVQGAVRYPWNKRVHSIADNNTTFAKLQQDLTKNNLSVHNLQEKTRIINTIIEKLQILPPIILILLSLLTIGNSIKIIKLSNARIKSS